MGRWVICLPHSSTVPRSQEGAMGRTSSVDRGGRGSARWGGDKCSWDIKRAVLCSLSGWRYMSPTYTSWGLKARNHFSWHKMRLIALNNCPHFIPFHCPSLCWGALRMWEKKTWTQAQAGKHTNGDLSLLDSRGGWNGLGKLRQQSCGWGGA